MSGEILPGDADSLGRYPFSLQILDGLYGRVLRHTEHPADRSPAYFRKDELSKFDHLHPALDDPVVTG